MAIDKDKSSQNALKWAVDNLLQKGQTILLLHVKPRASSVSTTPSSTNPNSSSKKHLLFLLISSFLSWNLMGCFFFLTETSQTNGDSSVVTVEPDGSYKQLFLPFRCLCSRKEVSPKQFYMSSCLSLPMLIMVGTCSDTMQRCVVGGFRCGESFS